MVMEATRLIPVYLGLVSFLAIHSFIPFIHLSHFHFITHVPPITVSLSPVLSLTSAILPRSHASQLPVFLRQYTAGAVYTRVLSYGVELLQYNKQYSQAVQQLEELIRQDTYHVDYRGRWYDRWALNLDYHLKHTNKVRGRGWCKHIYLKE